VTYPDKIHGEFGRIVMGDLPKMRKRKSGRVVMGDLPRWRNGLIVMGDLLMQPYYLIVSPTFN